MKKFFAFSNLWFVIFVFTVFKFILHVYTNAFAGYGIFRDELYYIACADHPALGYVDHPPLSIWFLMIVKNLFGDSVFMIRLWPALISSAAVFMVGVVTKEMGGKMIAISLACMAFIISGINLSYSTYYSMNSIDLLLWVTNIWLLIRIINTGEKKYWYLLGIVLGLTMLNKISGFFLGAGILVGLLATKQRSWLLTPHPYIAGLIALILFSPYIIWNVFNDFAHLEFIRNASMYKYASNSPLTFLSGQILLNNPNTIFLWLAGIFFYILSKGSRKYFMLFVLFLTVLTILLLNGTSKSEYLASAFTILFIGGGLGMEIWTSAKKWIGYTSIILLLNGLFIVPFAVPILPESTYVKYADALGIAPSTAENKELSSLPQFFADMHGWEQKAQIMAKAYHNLSPEDQKKCVIFGDNYGRCGAIDYYADEYGLPKSIGGHNNYWIWGPGDYTGDIILIFSDKVGNKAELFEEVTELDTLQCPYCMPYESDLKLYLCKGLKIPVDELWLKIKNFS